VLKKKTLRTKFNCICFIYKLCCSMNIQCIFIENWWSNIICVKLNGKRCLFWLEIMYTKTPREPDMIWQHLILNLRKWCINHFSLYIKLYYIILKKDVLHLILTTNCILLLGNGQCIFDALIYSTLEQSCFTF